MKEINISLVFFWILFSCQGQTIQEKIALDHSKDQEYSSYGERINDQNTLTGSDLLAAYAKISVKDTLPLKVRATVKEVCKVKGCWMKLTMGNGEEAMVRFKGYGFFVPKDIENKEVIVNGLAFVDEMSVEEQKHYAKDGGKSAEEIQDITAPKRTYSFEASGVLVKN